MALPGSSQPNRVLVEHQEAQPKAYTWHAHDWREALSLLGTTETGITTSEAKLRLKKYGPNRFTPAQEAGLVRRVVGQLKSPLTLVLVLAFCITLVLEEFLDAGVIGFALSIAVLVGVLQEGKASKAFKKLADSQVHIATIWRNGQKHEVDASELVPGDVVELKDGEQIPADLRLIFTKKLAVNEAALTGEWLAVKKQAEIIPVGAAFAEQKNMAWMGTFVSEGYGQGVVTATGDETSIGRLATNLRTIEDEATPLQLEMRQVSMVMLYIVVALVLFIFVIGLWQDQSLHDMLLMSIAIAVASVPEGLPAAVTIILAVGMESLLKRGGLVRNLLAAETLGSTTYVLTDKTGTLTEARMALTGIIQSGAKNYEPVGWKDNDEIRRVLDIALCGVNAYEDKDEQGQVLRGDPVERAILEQAINVGINSTASSLRSERIDVLPFTSENRFAAGLADIGDGYTLCINGAPEHLLKQASHVVVRGESVVLTEALREDLQADIDIETRAGKRLVGVSYKNVTFDDIPDDLNHPEELLENSVFVALLILNDPVRKGVKDAILGVQEAGANVILITGDNPETALSIARSVGIAGPSESALTGSDLEALHDDEVLVILDTVHVFARVLPQQKLRLAQILQQNGEIVAMTGDGINDAPALKKANIGIAIGSGTEVAKESSDLVLLNDSFETIHAAIEEGRRIIANLRKIVGYLLSTSLSEVVLIGVALLTAGPIPILPAQILWANVIEEGLMSVAFAFEKGEKNAMKQRPQDIHEEGILSGQMFWFMAFVITVLSTMSVVLYLYLRSLEVPVTELRSAMFLAISLDSLFMAFAFRSLITPFWRIPLHTNLFFIGSFLLSVALLGIALTVPFLQKVLSYTPLPLNDILLVLSFGVASLIIIELSKWLFFERQKS